MSIKVIRNKQGMVRYTIQTEDNKKIVKSREGIILGFIKDGKTFDGNGMIVSFDEDISQIIEEQK